MDFFSQKNAFCGFEQLVLQWKERKEHKNIKKQWGWGAKKLCENISFFHNWIIFFLEMKWWRGPQERRGGGNSLVSTDAKHSDLDSGLEFGFDLSLELRLDLSCLKQGNAFMLRIQIGECISHFGFWQQIFVRFLFDIVLTFSAVFLFDRRRLLTILIWIIMIPSKK